METEFFTQSELPALITQSNQLLAQLNASILFIIGVAAAVGVILVLYKFLRKFF